MSEIQKQTRIAVEYRAWCPNGHQTLCDELCRVTRVCKWEQLEESRVKGVRIDESRKEGTK